MIKQQWINRIGNIGKEIFQGQIHENIAERNSAVGMTNSEMQFKDKACFLAI